MAYVKYATSDTLYSLNDDTWAVEILRNDVGTATDYKFEVGPAGVQLVYESPEDDILVPGIVHSRVEVQTIWPVGVADELDDMMEAMVNSADGVWIMQLYKGGSKFWAGPIILDEVQLEESSAARSCKMVATDGISLLKTVDYNDDGSPYDTEQLIFDDVLKNIQEKWTSYDYVNETTDLFKARLASCDDMYSTDQAVSLRFMKEMKLSPYMYLFKNQDNETEYLDCYSLLDSICKTLLLRMYYYDNGWYFIPCYNQNDSLNGYKLNWSGIASSGGTIVNTYNYQVELASAKKIKGNDWTYTFTPPINEVTLTRHTNNGSFFLFQSGVAAGTTVSETGIDFRTDDTGYRLYGFARITRSAISPTVGLLDANRVGRYVLQFTVRFGNSPSTYQYYNNTAEPQSQGLFSFNFNFTTDGNSLVFTPINITANGFSTSAGNLHFHDPNGTDAIFDANESGTIDVPFSIALPAVPSDVSDVAVIPNVIVANRDAVSSTALTNTTDSAEFTIYFAHNQGDDIQPVPNFDIEAKSDFGRGSIKLGDTYVGQLHEMLGGILVRTGGTTYETSNSWRTVRYNYSDECNNVTVREVLAAHYKSRAVERGNIVMRDGGTVPAPFDMFVDDDTSNIYQCINYRLLSTPAELEVTLHKVGSDGQAQTETLIKDFGISPFPTVTDAVHPNSTIGKGFDSSFDFNNTAAEQLGADWSAIVGSETVENYTTYIGPGKGVFTDYQGDSAPSGYNIVRKVYTNSTGNANPLSVGWAEIHSKYRPSANSTLRQSIDKINLQWSNVTNPDRTFLITYSEVGTGLLDTYSNAQAAYSLRKLRAAYTGNAIEVRNDSGTLLDIGFDSNGDLDTAAILTHIGSGDGRVATWYDQSGNGRDATQSTLTLMPVIATGGTVKTVNGKPAIDFNSDYLDTTAFAPNPNGALNYLAVSQWDSTTVANVVASQFGSNTTTERNFYYRTKLDGTIQMSQYFGTAQAQIINPSASTQGNTQYIFSAEYASNTSNGYWNGNLITGTTNSGTPENDSEELTIGALGIGTQMLRGFVQEFVIWSNTSVLDADAISDDVNDYYGAF